MFFRLIPVFMLLLNMPNNSITLSPWVPPELYYLSRILGCNLLLIFDISQNMVALCLFGPYRTPLDTNVLRVYMNDFLNVCGNSPKQIPLNQWESLHFMELYALQKVNKKCVLHKLTRFCLYKHDSKRIEEHFIYICIHLSKVVKVYI